MIAKMSSTRGTRKARIAVLYHYFYPDDVVSARHLTQFCLDLCERGWKVEVLPCNRGCRDESNTYQLRESWCGLSIRRIWRPRFRQASSLGRLLNAFWMMCAWSSLGLRGRDTVPDVVVVGTDPVFSIMVALVIRLLRPRIRLVHWAFDLHPECTIAEGAIPQDGKFAVALRSVLRRAYHSCDIVADLGACMRQRLEAYGHSCRKVTLVPWALVEPTKVEKPDSSIRRELFGDSSLGLLYSGNFGRAHSCDHLLELARSLRNQPVHFAFAVRGNRSEELKATVRVDDVNVSVVGLVQEFQLGQRLVAADIHLVSLRAEWTGLVVPSKFFGALASGRPVLFAGPRDAAIARWIEEHQVGWVLDAESLAHVTQRLSELASDPAQLAELHQHCHQVYQDHFSRSRVMMQWHAELQALLTKGGVWSGFEPSIMRMVDPLQRVNR